MHAISSQIDAIERKSEQELSAKATSLHLKRLRCIHSVERMFFLHSCCFANATILGERRYNVAYTQRRNVSTTNSSSEHWDIHRACDSPTTSPGTGSNLTRPGKKDHIEPFGLVAGQYLCGFGHGADCEV